MRPGSRASRGRASRASSRRAGASRWSNLARLGVEDPPGVRRLLGDGSYGGLYSRPDEDWQRVWQTGVKEVREVLEHGWR
jgi:hypothetical protein